MNQLSLIDLNQYESDQPNLELLYFCGDKPFYFEDEFVPEVIPDPWLEDELLRTSLDESLDNVLSNSELLRTSLDSEDQDVLSKRDYGYGNGYIQKRLSQNKYVQYYFQWKEGYGKNRKTRSRYIPKNLINQIFKMNQEKAPVQQILTILKVQTKS